jgi:hypothetical protein
MGITKELHLIPGLTHREHHLANAVDDNDWVVVADLDEHLAVTAGQTIPAFLGRVDQMGYSLVHGEWVDRVAVGPATNMPIWESGKAGARLNAHTRTELRKKRQRSAREAIYRNRPIVHACHVIDTPVWN